MAGLVPGCDAGEAQPEPASPQPPAQARAAPLTPAPTPQQLLLEPEADTSVEYGADLVVTEVSGPASAKPGQRFPATVKVCNQGTSSSIGISYPYGSPRVELFLLMDTALTPPDPSNPSPSPDDQVSIGWVALDSLAPGQCVTKSVPAEAALPPAVPYEGVLYLAAVVDPLNVEQESREDNNVHVGGLMAVGYHPDLVVTEVSAAPASVRPGDGISATVKVCNQGTSAVQGNTYSGPRVELFVVTDATAPIPPGEMPIGSAVLDQTLYPSQCVTKGVSGSAHPPFDAQGEGAYSLVATVDRDGVVQELREDNNVRVSGMLGIGYRPDLVVTEVRSEASAEPWLNLPAWVTVCNQGTHVSGYAYPRPRVELFLSTLPELTPPSASTPYPSSSPSQVSIGWVELDELAAGQCVTKSVSCDAMLPPEAQGEGTYYLGAVVDTMNEEQELREDNNVRVEGLVGVGNRADLVVTGVKGPKIVGKDQSFTASVKVCNQGTASTSYDWPRVELYLSTDAELTIQGPSSRSIGQVSLQHRLSPGQCVTTNVDAQASLPPTAGEMDGAYYLAAAVDPWDKEQELREDNNVRVGDLMGVGYRADFVVTEVGFPASANEGQGFTASVKVCNQGSAAPTNASSPPGVLLILSMDDEVMAPAPDPSSPGSEWPQEQVAIGWTQLNQSLAPGQCETVSVPASAVLPSLVDGEPEGAYYLAAIVDAMHVEQELREDNNLRVGGLMGVGDRADLVVSEVSGPASASDGQSFTASVTVCNQGTRPAGLSSWSQVMLYFSSEATFTMPEQHTPNSANTMLIGQVPLYQPLYPGQCVTESVDAQAWLPPMEPQTSSRAYYLVAAVSTNHMEPELREDNNVRVGGLVGVGDRSDLMVSAVTAPASVEMGQDFTASVTVCNQGTVSTYYGPRVELILSVDTEVTLPTPDDPSPYAGDQMTIGFLELNQPLSAGQCVTEDVNVRAFMTSEMQEEMQETGALYLAAAVDTMNAEQELREDNNLRADTLLQLTH